MPAVAFATRRWTADLKDCGWKRFELEGGTHRCERASYLAGAVPVEDVRHEREALPREVIAQIRARSPLAVNVRAGLEALGRVHGTGMLVHLVGRGELLARTAAPVAHPGPARVHVFVDGLGRIHRRNHLDRRAAAGAGGGSHRRVRGGSCGDDSSGCRS